jgi:tetrahydromethanopterin S-methyltransferase subunit D
MAGIAHLGVGLASKRIAPQISVGLLIIGAYLIDIMFFIFMIGGLEQLPGSESPTLSPWSHGLFMAIIWSIFAGIITLKISKNSSTEIFFGSLVFSHWLIDFISHPMTYLDPNMIGLPVFFEGSPNLGLGLWSSAVNVNIGEGLFLIIGTIIYLQYRKEEKNSNKKTS